MPVDQAWEIGIAERIITPPLGSQMAGFDARNGTAESVHDDLHARALALSVGETTVILVSVEVIAVSREFSDLVRHRISDSTGVPVSHILLSATHTHCGPVTLNHFFNQGQPLDAIYLNSLSAGISEASIEAYAERMPRILRVGQIEIRDLAKNRRASDELPVDPFAGMMLIENSDGTPAAVAVNYACHTTCLGPNTLSITEDFPFFTLSKLKEQLGKNVMAMFINGAEGDLSIGHKSDLSAVGVVDSFRNFDTARILGERLADAALAGIPQLQAEPARIALVRSEVSLPLKNYEPLPEMTERRIRALAAIDTDVPQPELVHRRQHYLFSRIEEYYARLWESDPAAAPKSLLCEMIAFRLGNTSFISFPGEVFVRIALAIRENSPFPRTFFLGLTNDYIGYVPDKHAVASVGYEVIAARVAAEAAEIIEAQAVFLLQGINALPSLEVSAT